MPVQVNRIRPPPRLIIRTSFGGRGRSHHMPTKPSRNCLSACAAACFETLEHRRMLSAARLPAVQRPPADTIDQNVWEVVQSLRSVTRAAPASIGAARLDAQNRIQLDIQFADNSGP